MALIICTECGKEISDKATTCPNCGAPIKKDTVYVERPVGQITPQPKKKNNKVLIIGIVIAVIILIGLFGNSEETEQSTESKNTNSVEEVKEIEQKQEVEVSEAKKEEVKEETKKTIYYVGDIYKDRDIKITYLNAYEFTDFNDFNQPKDGYIVICAEFEVENISDSDQTVMYTDFNGYADGYEVEQSYSPEGTGMDFSLNLSAGRKGKGIVAFEVPIDSQEIQIEFSPNMFSDDKVIFSYK